jgi:hypothetical protein
MKILHFTHVECNTETKKTSRNSVFCAQFCLLSPTVGLRRTMKANESNTERKNEILHSSYNDDQWQIGKKRNYRYA